jgi:hypothetical protein
VPKEARTRRVAATSLAVHAGVSACDAICGARTGQRAAGSDHGQAVELLNQAGREGKDAGRVLTRLVPLKNRAEYEPEDVPKMMAGRAVDQAERIVQIARTVVQETPSSRTSLQSVTVIRTHPRDGEQKTPR